MEGKYNNGLKLIKTMHAEDARSNYEKESTNAINNKKKKENVQTEAQDYINNNQDEIDKLFGKKK